MTTGFPEQTFTHDGQNFVLVNGDVYVVESDGSRTFAEHLFDPDFYAKNFEIAQIDQESGERYPVTRRFREDFEQAYGLMSFERWHTDNTDPARAGQPANYYHLGNRVTRVTDRQHRGQASMRFLAKPAEVVSKAALEKNILYFAKGDHLYFSAWFYLEPTPDIYDVGGFTLCDFESTFMQSVGLRIIVRPGDALAFELKLPKTEFNQGEDSVAFPAGQWVNVKTHTFLSDKDGRVQLWQDGRKVLDQRGRTLPFANTIYDRLEIGITAIGAGSHYEKILYVDDLEISNTSW
jgi:hypothetical protein